jgi:hypothetical protein
MPVNVADQDYWGLPDVIANDRVGVPHLYLGQPLLCGPDGAPLIIALDGRRFLGVLLPIDT